MSWKPLFPPGNRRTSRPGNEVSCFYTVLPERFQLIEASLALTNIFTFCEHGHDRLTGGDRRSRPGDIGDGGNRERVATARIIDLDPGAAMDRWA